MAQENGQGGKMDGAVKVTSIMEALWLVSPFTRKRHDSISVMTGHTRCMSLLG